MVRRRLHAPEEAAVAQPAAVAPPLAHPELLPVDRFQREVPEGLEALLRLEESAVDEGGALGLEVAALAALVPAGLAAVRQALDRRLPANNFYR